MRVRARSREKAVHEGLDPEVVTATYTAMIDSFVTLELREHHSGATENH